MKNKWLNSFTVALFLTFISFWIYKSDVPLFRFLELKAYDLKIRARGAQPISGQVVIVAVDEKSLQREGRWPWPRTLMARLVDALTEAGAAVIGFDIFFPEKDAYVPFQTLRQSSERMDFTGITREALLAWLDEVGDSDRQFAAAIARSARTVLGFFVYPPGDKAGGQGRQMDDAIRELLSFSEFSIVQRADGQDSPAPLRDIGAMGLSLPEFTGAANASGFVSFVPEMDGVIRRVPMIMRYGDSLFPPLSLQMLQQATRQPLAARIAAYGVDGIRLGEAGIPVSENGDLLVNYRGPAFTFAHLSATDVLAGKTGAAGLEGKIVLVGGTAAGTHDIHTTPFGPLYPGVEVHANIMENILRGDFLTRPEWLALLDVGMIVLSGLFLGVVALHFQAAATASLLFLGVSGYLIADYYLFTRMGYWVNSVYPVFTQIFVYSGTTLFRFIYEEKEKRFIKGAFSQYLAPAVVEQLVKNPHLLNLGGERKVLTAFFSDVAGFSSISEKLTPEALVELLNVYLTEMTDIVLRNEGTVDKYVGDAIIAFFGAPIDQEDHAQRACRGALEMQRRLKELHKQWAAEKKPLLQMRIGLNTGPMVVGNMGSKARMDYTMMGDSVNLASRLEGTNKQYGTYLMVSQNTYECVKDDFEFRELDLIRVVGKEEPIKIYELLAEKGQIGDAMRQVVSHFEQGLHAYRRKEWDEAMGFFEKALELREEDGPALAFFQRCILFKNNPPAANWDGVFAMTSK